MCSGGIRTLGTLFGLSAETRSDISDTVTIHISRSSVFPPYPLHIGSIKWKANITALVEVLGSVIRCWRRIKSSVMSIDSSHKKTQRVTATSEDQSLMMERKSASLHDTAVHVGCEFQRRQVEEQSLEIPAHPWARLFFSFKNICSAFWFPVFPVAISTWKICLAINYIFFNRKI